MLDIHLYVNDGNFQGNLLGLGELVLGRRYNGFRVRGGILFIGNYFRISV